MKNLGALSAQQKTVTTAIVAAAIAFAGAVTVILPGVIDDINVRNVGEVVDKIAAEQAQAVNVQIEQLQSSLAAQEKEAHVMEAFQQGDATSLQLVADKLQVAGADSGVLHVQLIPVGINYAELGLRFSQLDRLNMIEHSTVVYPEAFEDAGKQLFDFILPVKDESGKVYGYILTVLDSKVFEKSFGLVKAETADVLLQQKFSTAKEHTVYRQGSGTGLKEVSHPAETTVPHWKVQVVPSELLLEDIRFSSLWLHLLQAAALIICVAALLFVNRKANVVVKKAVAGHTTPIQIKSARKVNKEEFAEQNAAQLAAGEDLADPLFQLGDVFDLDLDDDPLDVRAASPKASPAAKVVGGNDNFAIPAIIFRDYDIRGNADKDISDELAVRIGKAFGSECLEQGHDTVVLAGDGRISTPRLKAAVLEGLQACGCNVVDIGTVPTPLMNFAANTLSGISSGIMITASHNAAEDNGFKMVIGGHTLASEDIQRIRERVQNGNFCEGEGDYREQDIVDDYIEHIISDIVLAGSYKVVVDCGNGVASIVAPRLLEELGCDVVPLYCDVDGRFPNHAPDPSDQDNLRDLIEAVNMESADIGIAFDGDGDRLAVVTASGEIILPDCLLMLFAKDVVSRNPGTDIVFDVKSTRRLNALISSCGGRPVMCKSGHSHIKNKMLETGAMLGGELSGHIFFKERWFGFDDGMYSAARLLEIMSIRDQDLDAIFATFPVSASTPEIRIPVLEDDKFSIVKRLADEGEWGNGKVTTIDGVRVDFAKGWGLVRASNTSAALTMRFEADDADSLATVQHVFKQQLQLADNSLRLPF